ncbi:MAG: NADH-quinone oxidoreductase subunit NuoN [Alphaproteobacteria bacterium]|nr:NADH-quinone oxidoreductase subunit NuoN [Alphaproteobacteria bacterium]
MSTLTLSHLSPMLPDLFLAVAGMVLLVAGVLRGNESTDFIGRATIFCLAIAAALLIGMEWSRAEILNGMFLLDPFAGFMKLLVIGGLIASVALSMQYLHQDYIVRFEYPVLVLFSGIGMMLMVSAHDMLALYVGLELQSLALYVLAAIRRDHIKSAEAGMKYFVLGAISSGILLFGISLLYGYTGTTNFALLADTLSANMSLGVIIGLVFVLAGIAFKISAVPFHMWTPDVYEGAPTSVTAFFAIVPKVAALALLIRLLFEPFSALQDQWHQIIWFISLASMALGAFSGLVQNNIKRLLAYSSIGNMGYALIGVAAAGEMGITAVVVYLTIYMVMTAGVFGVVLCMRRDGQAVEKIDDLSGLSQNSPALAYALAILMFSLSGIPPLAGFFGKFIIFQAAVESGLYVLAVLGVLTSVVAANYYLRVIKVMFFDDPADKFDSEIAFSRKLIIGFSIFVTLVFILNPSSLVEKSRAAASALFNDSHYVAAESNTDAS